MDNLTPITREEMLMNDEPMTPITREEKILAGEDLNPVTRREYFLKKYRHAGGDVMVEGLEVTANGTYTAPEGKAYSPVEVDVPLPDNAYLLKEASGSLVSFSDGADLPMPSFICNIDAVQDLHGYDAPWVGGAGKNKLPMTVDGIKAANTSGTWSGNSYTANGVTFKIQTDNNSNVIGITVDTNGGTASADVIFYLSADSNRGFSLLQGTSYIVTADGATNDVGVRIGDSTDAYVGTAKSNPLTFTADSSNTARIGVNNGISISNVTIKPMIRLSTETDPTFAPYSNICPITGHTGLNAWLRGKNLANPSIVTTLYPTGNSDTYPNQILNSSNIRSVIAEVTPDTTYTISKKAGQRFRLAFTTEEPAVGVADYGYESKDTRTTITVTSPSNAKYMVVLFWSANFDTDTEEDMLATLQIEIGETATTYEPYNPNSQTIQVSWQTEAGEVFGGYVDLVSGVLTVDKASTTLGQFSYTYNSTNKTFYSGANQFPSAYQSGYASCTCSYYLEQQASGAQMSDKTIKLYNGQIYVKDTSYTDATEFKTSVADAQIVYQLATPITYQLTPQQIKSLQGNNNAWCSTGDVNLDYFAKEVTG